MALVYSNAGPILQSVNSIADALFPSASQVSRNRYYAAQAQLADDRIQAQRRLSDMIRTVQNSDGYKAAAAQGPEAARAYITRQLHAEVPFLKNGMGNAGKWASQMVTQAFPNTVPTAEDRSRVLNTGGMAYGNTETGQARKLANDVTRTKIATGPSWYRAQTDRMAKRNTAVRPMYDPETGQYYGVDIEGKRIDGYAVPNARTKTVPTVDPKTGKVVLTPEARATGRTPGPPASASSPTALQKNAQWLSETRGIPLKEAQELLLKTKGLSYETMVQRFANTFVQWGATADDAVKQAKELADRVYGLQSPGRRQAPVGTPGAPGGKQPDRSQGKTLSWPGKDKARAGQMYVTPKGRRVRVAPDGSVEAQTPDGKWVKIGQ